MDVRNLTDSTVPLQGLQQVAQRPNLGQKAQLRFEQDPAALIKFSPRDLGKSLEITAEQILQRINKALGPDYQIKAEQLSQYTPEATAERIFKGVTALFPAFQRQNPDLENEELISSFMSTIRSGIDQGYGEAINILEAIGAFTIDGVKQGIEQTMILLDAKLGRYEETMRKPAESVNNE